MSLKDYVRGYVDCRNDEEEKRTRIIYNGLVSCVGLDIGTYDYNRFNHALNILAHGEKVGDKEITLPSASFAQFKEYLISNKDAINALWEGKDNVDNWLERMYEMAKYLKAEKTVDKDVERILGMSKGAYIDTDKVSGKQYLMFDRTALNEMFKLSGHSVEKKDKDGNDLPEDKHIHSYWSEKSKIYAYTDYTYQVYRDHPEVIEELMKEGNLAELNMVFNNKIDIDYANKTASYSNCDRYFEGAVKEEGILTTLMIAYQDINERMTMLLLNKNHNLDLIMNPDAAHDSKINGHSGADADFQEKGTKNYLELQTKQMRDDKYKEYNPNHLIYKMTKHKSFKKYIDEGKSVYHLEKAMNNQKSFFEKNGNGYNITPNAEYLHEHYTVYDMNAIIKEIEKHPECLLKDKTYATYNAMAIDVSKLEDVTGQTLKIEIDKVQEEQREFQKLIDKYLEKAMAISEKLPEKVVESDKTLDDKINAAKNKQVNKITTEHKKERERE